ncbi:MAG: metalloregulator ArsR/SmtB family transcription factor [Gemmataceae bacterium]
MPTDRLSLTFSALSDPIRRAILAHLARGERSVNELAKPFKISLPGISRHLKVLERAGLISRSRQAQARPCTLEVAPLNQAAEWLDRYRRASVDRLDRLGAYLETLQRQEKTHGRKQ